MKKLIKRLTAIRKTHLKDKAVMDRACKRDPDIQDDTEWVNDYYQLLGFIEGVEFALDEAKDADWANNN